MADRPARVTTNLKIPVPGDAQYADYVSDWGAVADATDAAVTKTVNDAATANAAAIEAANTGFASAITSAQNSALPYSLLLMGA